MIRKVVDFALNNRFLILAAAVLLMVWGVISFHNLPVEAYPDVASNYVEIVTQWPGRAAEEVEQQVTIPVEIAVNGIPHLEHLRSITMFGLSTLILIFDDESDNNWNRQKVTERLAQAELPSGLEPEIGADFSPVGEIFFYTLQSTNPRYDLMDLKSLDDWVVHKQFFSVPNVVDVAGIGGITREYQVRIDPDKLVAYGLSLSQVEEQLSGNNSNAGGSFVEVGLQQVNVRVVGLVRDVDDIRKTVIKTQNGTPVRISDIATVEQGTKIRLGQVGQAIQRTDGKIFDRGDVVAEQPLPAQRRERRAHPESHPQEGRRDQRPHSAPGREDRSLPGPQRPHPPHHQHRAAQPRRRLRPGVGRPLPVPRQRAQRPHRRPDHSVLPARSPPSSSIFARFPRTSCRWAPWISAWWWMARSSWSRTSCAISATGQDAAKIRSGPDSRGRA